MAYLRSTVGHRRGHRKNGYPSDQLCPDGVVEYGWRLVRAGGTVKFVGCYWQDDKLISHVGQYVTVVVTDCTLTGVNVYTEYPSGDWRQTHICKIGNG